MDKRNGTLFQIAILEWLITGEKEIPNGYFVKKRASSQVRALVSKPNYQRSRRSEPRRSLARIRSGRVPLCRTKRALSQVRALVSKANEPTFPQVTGVCHFDHGYFRHVSADPRSRRRRTLHPDQRDMLFPELARQPAVYAYSFILTSLDVSSADKAAAAEHWNRHRTTVENIFRDSKLGAALRHLPSGYGFPLVAWTHRLK
jgi:hypothetical protein